MNRLLNEIEKIEKKKISKSKCYFCGEKATGLFWYIGRQEENFVCKKHHDEVKKIYGESKAKQILIQDEVIKQIELLKTLK